MIFLRPSAVGGSGGSLLFLLLFILSSISTSSESRYIPEEELWDVQRAVAATDEVTIEAEDGTYDGVTFEDNHDGFSGMGFVDFGGPASSVAWLVDIPCTGAYEVTIRYASRSTRPVRLVVDGSNVAGGTFNVRSTREWTNWTDETIMVTLSGGDDQELKLVAQTEPGPNVDTISYKAVQDCNSTDTDPRATVKIVLAPSRSLMRNNFVTSLNGAYQAGLDGSGDLVVRDAKSQQVLWSLGQTNGLTMWMQDDGNLVMRNSAGKAIWTSRTLWSRRDRAYFVLSNTGALFVMLLLDDQRVLWTGGIPRSGPTSVPAPTPVSRPTAVPVSGPTRVPNAGPTRVPTSGPPSSPSVLPSTVVIKSNDNVGRNVFRHSPNGRYCLGLDGSGILTLRDGTDTVWQLRDQEGNLVTGVSKAFVQTDGNLVLRDSTGKGLWASQTSLNYGATLQVDDGGRVAIVFQGTPLWMDGIPRGRYVNGSPSSRDLVFPVRGAFYYGWYPETWSVQGKKVFYRPNLKGINQGFYRSGDPAVVTAHVKAMDYGWIDLGIATWFGPGTQLDVARITQIMDETRRQGSNLKWTVYYEDEEDFNYPVSRLVEDLNYLKKWFAWHPTFAHKDGKPVIFVWNEGNCEVASRWAAASKQAGWYVVLKLFRQYRSCPFYGEIDSWHQYGVTTSYIENPPYSFNIAPGFWRADKSTPDVARPGKQKFCQWVATMNESGQPWQLITSFNEWGEGTAVESAVEWQSASGYGDYLDCLHDPLG